MSASIPQPQPLSQLLWQHYRWHLRTGTGIWAVTILPLFLFNYPFGNQSINKGNIVNIIMYDYLPFITLLLLFCFLFALVSGLIRHPLLAYLSKKARTSTGLVWQSMLLFELSVALLAFVPWPVAYNQFSAAMVKMQFLASAVLSLPWLLATGLASRKLAAALALPGGSR